MQNKGKVITLVIGLVTGMTVGIGTMMVVAICLSRNGSDFETIPYAYESSADKTVFHTPKFTLVFEGLDVRGAGSGSMTISGEYGVIPAFWRMNYGPTQSWGSKCVNLYDPVSGIAIIDFNCNVFEIRHDPPLKNSVLSIGATSVDLSGEPPVIIVARSRAIRVADAEEAKTIVMSLPKSLLDFGAARAFGAGPEVGPEPEPILPR